MKSYRERLDAGSLVKGRAVGEFVDKERLVSDELAESPVGGRSPEKPDVVAQIVPSAQAELTLQAGHTRFNRHAVTRPEVIHLGTNGYHLSCRLVTENQWFCDDVVLDSTFPEIVKIASADTRCRNSDESFVTSALGLADITDGQHSRTLKICSNH